jgi:uncharacterized protein
MQAHLAGIVRLNMCVSLMLQLLHVEAYLKQCNSCGKCCTKYGADKLSVSADESAVWQLYRPEIHRYVANGEIWFDPATGQQTTVCPWLQKEENRYTCAIYHSRPDDCRYYPALLSDMISDECEMLEARDLSDPTQAQKDLDIIMSDSRQPTTFNG